MENINSEKYKRLINKNSCASILKKNTITVNQSEVANAIIVCDIEGNKIIKDFIEMEAEHRKAGDKNTFLDTLVKHHNHNSRQQLIDDHLMKKRQALQDLVKKGSGYYFSNLYAAAANCFRCALKQVEDDPYSDEFQLGEFDTLTFMYAEAICSVAEKSFPPIQHAIEIFYSLIPKYGDTFPSLYYSLGRTMNILDNYEKCAKILNEGLRKLEKCNQLIELQWPGTSNVITDTEKISIRIKFMSLLNNNNIYRLADETCCYPLCAAESKNMFYDSLSFFGYIHLKCSKQCNFCYHPNCWKHYLKESGHKTVANIMKTKCETNSCYGLINFVAIYDENRIVKSKFEFVLEKLGNQKEYKENKDDVKNSKTNKLTSEDNMKLNPCSPMFYPNQNVKKQDKTSSVNSCNSSSCNSSSGNENISALLNNNAQTNVIQQAPVENNSETKLYEKSTQTHINSFETLRNENYLLYEALYKAEDDYNVICNKYKSLEHSMNSMSLILTKSTSEISTQTITATSHACVNTLPSNLEQQMASLKSDNEKLLKENSELKCSLQNERQKYSEYASKTEVENTYLKQKIAQLTNLWNTRESNTVNKDHNKLTTLVINQLNHNRHILVSYLTSFNTKCSGIIWEMENALLWSTDETVPTRRELEDHIQIWKAALNEGTRQYVTIVDYHAYSHNKIQAQEWDAFPMKHPIEDILKEPPNLLVTCFRALLSRNKKLETDLLKYMYTFYNSMNNRQYSISYDTPAPINEASIPAAVPVQEVQEPLQTTHVEEVTNTDKEMLLIATCADSNKVLQEAGDACANGPSVPFSEFKTSANMSVMHDDVDVSRGAISKTNTTLEYPEAARRSMDTFLSGASASEQKTDKKVDVIGVNALLEKLMKYFPLTPDKIVADAISKVREQRGGLTGLNCKEIVTEVRAAVNGISEKPVSRGLPATSTWATMDHVGVTWNNPNTTRNCSICFEYMDSNNCLKLNCQHAFHNKCIKTWLQNSSICPICRAFTTLPEGYPRLTK